MIIQCTGNFISQKCAVGKRPHALSGLSIPGVALVYTVGLCQPLLLSPISDKSDGSLPFLSGIDTDFNAIKF
jgi:hypothetical protein